MLRIFKRKKKDESHNVSTDKSSNHSTLDFDFFTSEIFSGVDYSKILGDFGDFDRMLSEAKIIAKFGSPDELIEVKIPYGYSIIEKYWVNKPFAMVYILYNENTNEYLYYLIEPKLIL